MENVCYKMVGRGSITTCAPFLTFQPSRTLSILQILNLPKSVLVRFRTA